MVIYRCMMFHFQCIHVQLKDPSVLLQKALTSQSWALDVHSLISGWREKNALVFVDRLLQ